MANYLITYYGGGMPESPEAQAKALDAWNSWFAGLGSAVVDAGNPTIASRAISADGSVMDATMAPSGYSIFKADSLDAAIAAAKGCPVLADTGAVVVVSETVPAM